MVDTSPPPARRPSDQTDPGPRADDEEPSESGAPITHSPKRILVAAISVAVGLVMIVAGWQFLGSGHEDQSEVENDRSESLPAGVENGPEPSDYLVFDTPPDGSDFHLAPVYMNKPWAMDVGFESVAIYGRNDQPDLFADGDLAVWTLWRWDALTQVDGPRNVFVDVRSQERTIEGTPVWHVEIGSLRLVIWTVGSDRAVALASNTLGTDRLTDIASASISQDELTVDGFDLLAEVTIGRWGQVEAPKVTYDLDRPGVIDVWSPERADWEPDQLFASWWEWTEFMSRGSSSVERFELGQGSRAVVTTVDEVSLQWDYDLDEHVSQVHEHFRIDIEDPDGPRGTVQWSVSTTPLDIETLDIETLVTLAAGIRPATASEFDEARTNADMIAAALEEWLDDACAETVFEELASPDGSMVAIIFERDCGLFSEFHAAVAIEAIGPTGATERTGPVYYEPRTGDPSFGVTWRTDTELEITRTRDGRLRNAQWSEYRTRSPDGKIVIVHYLE